MAKRNSRKNAKVQTEADIIAMIVSMRESIDALALDTTLDGNAISERLRTALATLEARLAEMRKRFTCTYCDGRYPERIAVVKNDVIDGVVLKYCCNMHYRKHYQETHDGMGPLVRMRAI